MRSKTKTFGARLLWLYFIAIKHPKVIFWCKLLMVFGIFFVVSRSHVDPDFGWHLISGGYYRAHGIPTHDIYTYTAPNFPWVNHEWGNDVLLSFIYQLGGYTLASAAYSAIWTTAIFLSNKKARIGVLLLSATAIVPYVGIRPTAWTALLIVVLLKLYASKSKNAIYYTPLLMVIWVNLHAGFTVGLAIMLYFAISKWRQSSRWLVFLLCIAVSIANPYGWNVFTEVARTMFDHSLHDHIIEWRQAFFPARTRPFLLLWAVGFWFFSRHTLNNWLRPQSFLLLASFLATRNVPLMVIVAQTDLEYYFEKSKIILKKELKHRSSLAIGLLAAGSIICSLFMLFVWHYPGIASTKQPAKKTLPAVIYMQEHPCQGNLFNDYDYGGYLIWKLPDVKLYIDGRMPSWKDENNKLYYDRYLAIMNDRIEQRKEFSRYNIQCVLVSDTAQWEELTNHLKADGWQLINVDRSILLINKSSK